MSVNAGQAGRSGRAKAVGERAPGRAWVMLALGLSAQTATAALVAAPAFLIPSLQDERGLTLAQAGLLASAPTLGMVLVLIAWGALTDRVGERWVLAGGLLLTAAAGAGAALASGDAAQGVFLVLVGMAAASSGSASGRVVVSWFPRELRGLAMGIRQMSQPLGATLAALVVPSLAATSGTGVALLPLVVVCVVVGAACAAWVVNPSSAAGAPAGGRAASRTGGSTGPAPAEPDRSAGAARGDRGTGNPYRRSSFLARIHLVSVLLVVPQYTLTTFGLVWLIGSAGWGAVAAGVLVGSAQLVGALGRIGVGALSDRVGSRVRVLRWVAVAACAAMLAVAVVDAAPWALVSAVVFVLATVIAVADNGLAFTSVAEVAGPSWSGRARGVQNTGQYLAASAVGPVVGALIATVGFPLAFAVVAVCPALAVPLVPGEAEGPARAEATGRGRSGRFLSRPLF